MSGALALVTVGTSFALASLPAQAAPTTRYVTVGGSDVNGQTPNDCTDATAPCFTISHAIDEADLGDTVDIGAGTYPESVRIRKSLTLIGAGASGGTKTVIDGDPESGDASIMVDGRDVNQTVAITVKDIAVDGNADNDGIFVTGDATLDLVDSSASNNDADGLLVEADGATATVESSTVSGNRDSGVVGQSPPRALSASAVKADVVASDITISNSDLSNNGRFGLGLASQTGAVDHSNINRNGQGGVDVFSDASLVLTTSTLDANDAAGVIVDTATASATVAASTISHTAPDTNAGPFSGFGLANHLGTLDVQTSTVVGNTGQGVLNVGGVTTVANSTINGTRPSSNDSPAGALVNTALPAPALQQRTAPTADVAVDTPASLTVTGSIVAEQGGSTPDCDGDIADGGFNLSSDAANSCKFSVAKGDQVSTNPLLGALGDNGGPTQTELLLKGSPAIDAIPSGDADCAPAATDQRGVTRPQPAGGACDTGAVEMAADPLVVHPDSLPSGTVGQPYSATVTATGGAYPTYVFSLVSGDALPPGLALDADGHITGTPTTAGSFTFTVSINDPVLKQYTIVIAPAASSSTPPPSTSGSTTPPTSTTPAGNSGSPTATATQGTGPIAITGVDSASMLSVGAAAVLGGLALLFGTGRIGRRPRHRRAH